tara:strand:- start:7851 stop:8267 length:417 start_codon:yes stop_codon:yes gene_type:complete
MGKVGQYFSADEFACACCGKTNPSQLLVSILDEVRCKLGPLRINSSYRCESHNAQVGGAKESWHLPRNGVAYAADITYVDSTKRHGAYMLRLYIELENAARRRKKNYGLGLYESFVHFDTRGEEGAKAARWFKYNWPR